MAATPAPVGAMKAAGGMAAVIVRAPEPGAETTGAFAVLVSAVAVVARGPVPRSLARRATPIRPATPACVRDMRVRDTRQILEMRRRPPAGGGREMETRVVRVTRRRHAFAGIMNIRMPEVEREVRPGQAARVEAMVVDTTSYAETKGRAYTGVPLFKGPPGAPIGGPAAQEAVGPGRETGQPTPPQIRDTGLNLRVAAEGLPATVPLEVLPVASAVAAVAIPVDAAP